MEKCPRCKKPLIKILTAYGNRMEPKKPSYEIWKCRICGYKYKEEKPDERNR